jgi:hypothetical protein
MSSPGAETKKQAILDIAEGLGLEKFTPAEVEQIRRQLVVKLGASGKTSPDYIAEVLAAAGRRVVLSTEADTHGQYEETLEEAEICLMRLDELWRKFRAEGERAAAERVLEVARLGRRRAEMIARNPRVEAYKRDQKQEILEWFRIWLETPDTFFDWLDLRKQSAEYQHRFVRDVAPGEE